MNKKIITIILLSVALTWFLVWFFSNDRDLMKQNKELIKVRDSLRIENKVLAFKNDSLQSIEKTIIKNYYTINDKIKDNDKKINNVNDYVYSLNERAIDSTIRHHSHKPYNGK